jgi:hypothetical protein
MVHQPPAGFVDVLDPVGEMAEIAAFAIALLVPIVGELDLGFLVARRGQEDQGEAPLLIVHAADFPKAEQIEEADRFVGIGHADHGVEIFHGRRLSSAKAYRRAPWPREGHRLIDINARFIDTVRYVC